MSQTLVERAALARILGVSVRTIATLEAEHVIEATARGKGRRPSKYTLELVVPAYIAHTTRRGTGSEASARAARDEAQAELLRLRIARERGDVVARETVVSAGRGVVETARTRLVRLPTELRRAGVVDAAGEAQVERVVRSVLEELARLESVA